MTADPPRGSGRGSFSLDAIRQPRARASDGEAAATATTVAEKKVEKIGNVEVVFQVIFEEGAASLRVFCE